MPTPDLPEPNADLIGQTYRDPIDSGNLVMQVFALDALDPRFVYVHPAGAFDRIWWRSAQRVRELIAASGACP